MKADIQKVIDAFHAFHVAMVTMPHFSSTKAWEDQASTNRTALREAMEELGLAEHIDWNPEE